MLRHRSVSRAGLELRATLHIIVTPMCAPQLYPEHDLFIQSMKLKNTLRWMMGEDLITHLGNEYYD